MDDVKVRQVGNGVVFSAKVVPGSSRTAVSGLLDGMVKIKVSAPAEKGKANKCLVGFLAKQLGVKKSDVSIISGRGSPIKTVRVSGVLAEGVREKLGLEGDI
ncbi:MAG: YggU family protein [Planctomycetota bacterium]|nr:MAG: YggU family protein [Planctomycetota bacterium]